MLASTSASAAAFACFAFARSDSTARGAESRAGSAAAAAFAAASSSCFRLSQVAFEGPDPARELLERPVPTRGERALPAARPVPLGDRSGRLLVVASVDRTRVESKALERLLELEHVTARGAGDEVSIGRGLALKNEHGAPGSGEQHGALAELLVPQRLPRDHPWVGLQVGRGYRDRLRQSEAGRAPSHDVRSSAPVLRPGPGSARVPEARCARRRRLETRIREPATQPPTAATVANARIAIRDVLRLMLTIRNYGLG